MSSASKKRSEEFLKIAGQFKLGALVTRLDDIKKKIVATTEGGAITGEERIREHLDYAYGALQS